MQKWLLCLYLIVATPLVAEVKVLAFAGSTRADSYNKKLVQEAAQMARQMGAAVTVIDLKDYPLPLYDGELEIKEGLPANAKRLRQLMIESQAIIIASPEYNSSISGVLKNTLDWASRDENGQGSREAFKNKKFAIISASPGSGGGNRALLHLRSIIENIGGTVITEQLSVPQAHEAFDAQGQLINPELRQQLKQEIHQLLNSNNETE